MQCLYHVDSHQYLGLFLKRRVVELPVRLNRYSAKFLSLEEGSRCLAAHRVRSYQIEQVIEAHFHGAFRTK